MTTATRRPRADTRPRSDTAKVPPDLARWSQILFDAAGPGAVLELRALGIGGNKKRVDAGYFVDADALAKAAAQLDGKGAVYVTLNPCDPSLLSRANGRVKEWAERAVSGEDVTARRWLYVDLDPKRKAGIPASDDEHKAATNCACRMAEQMHLAGWPMPIVADSGNGAYVLWRVELPNDTAARDLLAGVLKGLAIRFSETLTTPPAVELDPKVYDANRLARAIGTMNKKGDGTPDRPHRRSRILDVPAELRPVSREQLEAVAALAAPAPAPAPRKPIARGDGPDVRARATAYLARIPGAVEGHGGDEQTFKAALAMLKGFSLPKGEALELLTQEYNPRCSPPWSEKELAHKVTCAAESRTPDGYLLNEGQASSRGPGNGTNGHHANGASMALVPRPPDPPALDPAAFLEQVRAAGDAPARLALVFDAAPALARLAAAQLEPLLHTLKLELGSPLNMSALRTEIRNASPKASSDRVADMVRTVLESGSVVVDRSGAVFKAFPCGQHVELHNLRSRFAKGRLAGELKYNEPGADGAAKTPSLQTVEAATYIIESAALAGDAGPRVDVALRVASTEAGEIAIDRGDGEWSAIVVRPSGYHVEPRHPAPFRRGSTMQALPVPLAGGSFEALWRCFPGLSRRDQVLLLGWLVCAIQPPGPAPASYPVLVLTGEQGSGKTTLARVLRWLVDPADPATRRQPREERDLFIAAGGSWVVSLNNVSSLPADISDALCALATEGGYATRALHTDSEESVFRGRRPIIINGISGFATRGDLLDRAIPVHLPTIADADRRSEKEIHTAFEAAHARLLGCLLDAAACGLRRRAEVQIDDNLRMADACLWVEACAPALGLEPGEFLATWREARGEADEEALDGDAVGAALRNMLATRSRWTGPSGALLSLLGEAVPERERRSRDWPETPRALTSRLVRLAPQLRRVGVELLRGPRRSWIISGQAVDDAPA